MSIMNEVQTKIAELQDKGWTLAALADEVGVTTNAVEKWKAGDRNPSNLKAILLLLDNLMNKKRIPKRRRYIIKGKVGLSDNVHIKHKDKNDNVKGLRFSGIEGIYSMDTDGKTYKESAGIDKNYIVGKETENKRLINRWLSVFNRENKSHYVISGKPIEQASIIDILIENPETKREIGIQITHSDAQAIRELKSKKKMSREGDLYLTHSVAIKKRIGSKSERKYPLEERNKTILALDGWFGTTRSILNRLKVEEKDFLKEAGYLQIWFVGLIEDEIVRLY